MPDVFPPVDELWPEPPVDHLAERRALADALPDPDDDLNEASILELLAHADGSEHWTCQDDDQAEWLMRNLASIDGRLTRFAMQRREYLDRIDRWFRKVAAPLEGERPWFVAQLKLYAWRRRAEAGIKTVKLPSGEVATRTQGKPQASIADPDALLAWAKVHAPETVKVTEVVQVSELRKVARVIDEHVFADLPDPDTGEMVPTPVPGTTVTVTAPSATPKPYEVD